MKKLIFLIAFSLGCVAFPSYARFYCVPVKDKCAPKADKCAPKAEKIDLGNCAKCTECPSGFKKVNYFWVR